MVGAVRRVFRLVLPSERTRYWLITTAKSLTGLLDVFVIDERDAHLTVEIERLGMDVVAIQTVMHTAGDRERLAEEILAAAL